MVNKMNMNKRLFTYSTVLQVQSPSTSGRGRQGGKRVAVDPPAVSILAQQDPQIQGQAAQLCTAADWEASSRPLRVDRGLHMAVWAGKNFYCTVCKFLS